MLLKNLTKVWVSEYAAVNEYGEKSKKWKNKNEIAYLNFQQDINELDRKSSGEVDYSILNARTDREYNIEKGNGISLLDISEQENFVPDYVVTDSPQIGKSILYKLRKYNGKV